MRSKLTVGTTLVLLMGLALPTPLVFADEKDREEYADQRGLLPKLVLIAPGTTIGTAPPSPWTHLVLKSLPKLATGDLETLPRSAKKTATLFRMVILADVQPPGGHALGHTLRRIGVGLCVPVDGVDTVVTSSSLDALRIKLDLVPRTVLGRSEEELLKGRIKARTSTFALFTTPAAFKFATGHAPASLRYAFLVDSRTGALHTLVWAVAADPAARAPATTGNLLAPGLVFDCGLDVVADRLFDRIPVYWSFAMVALPPGQAVAFPASLQRWTVRDRFTPEEAEALESELRGALFGTTSPREVISETRPRPPIPRP